jgi:hypothetical protein
MKVLIWNVVAKKDLVNLRGKLGGPKYTDNPIADICGRLTSLEMDRFGCPNLGSIGVWAIFQTSPTFHGRPLG